MFTHSFSKSEKLSKALNKQLFKSIPIQIHFTKVWPKTEKYGFQVLEQELSVKNLEIKIVKLDLLGKKRIFCLVYNWTSGRVIQIYAVRF